MTKFDFDRRKYEVKSLLPKNRKTFDHHRAFVYFCTPDIYGRLPALSDVARAFGISSRTVEKYSSRNQWIKRRDEQGKKTVENFFSNRDEKIQELDMIQFRQISLLEETIINVIARMNDAQKAFSDPKKTTEQKLIALKQLKNEAFDLEKLTNALKTAHNQKRIMLGMPTEISKADVTTTEKSVKLSEEKIKEIDEFISKNGAKNTNAETKQPQDQTPH